MQPTDLHPSSGRRRPLAMRLQSSTYQIGMWAMMLKHFSISSPTARCDPPLAQDCGEGDVGILPYTQE